MRKRSKFREGDVCKIVDIGHIDRDTFSKVDSIGRVCEITAVIPESISDIRFFIYHVRMLDTGEEFNFRSVRMKRVEKKKHVGKIVGRNVGIL
jgi:hypothetical protein